MSIFILIKKRRKNRNKKRINKARGCDMLENWNERIKKMTVMDIGLVKWSVFFFTIIIVKLFPQLSKINYAVLIVLVLACGIKPLYKFWIKK